MDDRDISPHVNLLRSLRGERINYALLVGEAVDNSFDAGANRVDIEIDKERISFHDDGAGISKDRMRAVFTLGAHGAMLTTALGRFGIGLKSMAVNAGDVLEVSSVSKDGRVNARVNWRELLASGRWRLDDMRWRPVGVGTPTGTTIRITELRKVRPPQGGWETKIVADIAERFHPAIASGRIITVNGREVPLLQEPEMTDVVEQTFYFSEGRSAHLRAGILKAPSKLCRMHVGFKHRTIMPSSTFGIAEYSGLTKMFGRLLLSGPWRLAKFKDDLTDEGERDELESKISEALADMLEKCSTQHEDVRLTELTELINDMLPEDLKPSARPHKRKEAADDIEKEKRKRRTNGFVSPDKSDPSKGPARAMSRKGGAKLVVTFDGDAETEGIGVFIAGRPHQVNLSRENPAVAYWIAHRDQSMAVKALREMACLLYEAERPLQQEQGELPYERIGMRVAKLLALQDPEGDTSPGQKGEAA